METGKRKRLEAAGRRVGEAGDFLDLSPEETALVDMRVALSTQLRAHRVRARLTQADLARRLSSSQSRVAKLDAADPSGSLDLLIRALLAVGATRHEVARALAKRVAWAPIAHTCVAGARRRRYLPSYTGAMQSRYM
ncbi:MAG: transcriptional regulator [Gemmatimonadaceae bacterium]